MFSYSPSSVVGYLTNMLAHSEILIYVERPIIIYECTGVHSMGKWQRPMGSFSLKIYLGNLALMILIVMPGVLLYGSWVFIEYLAFLIAAVLMALAPYVALNLLSGEVSYFTFKIYDKPSHGMIPDLERALTAKGIPFANRRGHKGSPWKIKEFLDLDRGMVTIALGPVGENTRIFLGPVEPDNGVVIERLKGLIDGAVG